MIICLYSGVVYKYRITKGSHTNTSFSNISKYSFRGFIEMYFKMTNIVFKTNVLGFEGVALTNKSLLFPYNACVNINSLPFVSVSLGPYSYVLRDRVQFHGDLIPAQ